MITKPAIITVIVLTAFTPALIAAQNGDWCAGIKDIGKIHSDPDHPFLQSLSLEGRIHYQSGLIVGNDNLGNGFNESFDDFRRVRLGWKAQIIQHFTAQTAVDLVFDNRFRGGDQDWGFQRFETATLTFDMKSAFPVDDLDSLTLSLNWYPCGHNLKLMGGVEYADLTTPAGGVDALTCTMAVRMKF